MNRFKLTLLGICLAGLAAGFALPLAGRGDGQQAMWGATAGLVLVSLLVEIATSLRRGEFGLDIVAALSMSAAIWFGETLAAAVVALMYAGGQLLEDYAGTRARAEMKALVGRAPKTALRYDDGHLREVAIDALAPGDRILVRQGDVVPADGRVTGGKALLDQSVLTGESVPVPLQPGEEAMSGSASLDTAFDLVVLRAARDSTYSGIVRMVEAAQAAKAPMVRIADRYAMLFLGITVALAAAAFLATGDEQRLLAVLVSATPCPLILAVPVALVSGISKAAKRGVLVKGGPVLEALARATVLVIDKTGTLTEGRARLVDIVPAGRRRPEDILRLAASLDQASGHAIAASLVTAARERRLALSMPVDAAEEGGAGIVGRVDGHHVAVGGHDFVRRRLKRRSMKKLELPPGAVGVSVAVDGHFAGVLVLADTLRADAGHAIARLRRAGIARVVLASGDHEAVVADIAGQLDLDAALAALTPEEKVAVVIRERANGVVLMAGDGVNDAPALAAAEVGMSMGARGAPASAEAADAVLLVDNLERIAEAVEIARRSRAIALQSVYAGLGLSLAAMAAAAFGYLPVLQGALLQEAIDVAVVLNALRALR